MLLHSEMMSAWWIGCYRLVNALYAATLRDDVCMVDRLLQVHTLLPKCK